MVLSAEEFQNQVGSCMSFNFEYELLMTIHMNYYLACKKMDETQHVYNSMLFFLWNAVKPDKLYHDAQLTDPLSILWQRHLNWQTAALWINQCGDYMLQIVWLGLGLHKYEQITAKTYELALKDCNYIKVTGKLREKESKIILPIVESYYEDSGKVRKWVNQLKHRGIIECNEIEGELKDQCFSIKINYDNGNSVCEKDLMPELVSIGEATSVLIATIINFQKTFNELVRYFDTDNFFNKNVDGAIILPQVPKKPDV